MMAVTSGPMKLSGPHRLHEASAFAVAARIAAVAMIVTFIVNLPAASLHIEAHVSNRNASICEKFLNREGDFTTQRRPEFSKNAASYVQSPVRIIERHVCAALHRMPLATGPERTVRSDSTTASPTPSSDVIVK